MKKMKKVVSLEAPPYAVYEDARARLKHQRLNQDYQELEKVINFSGFSLDLIFVSFSVVKSDVWFCFSFGFLNYL